MLRKTAIALAAVATVAVATPAFADDRSGARVGVELGVLDDDFLGTDEISYGINAGYDFDLGGVVAGPIAGYTSAFDNDFDIRELSIGGRVGAKLTEQSLFYGAVSYSNIDADDFPGSLDGVKFGVGYEQSFGRLYANIETRYATYDYDIDVYQTVIGAGVRF